MAIYPITCAGGSAPIHKGRRAHPTVPTVRDVKRAAQRAARKTLKRERHKTQRAHRRPRAQSWAFERGDRYLTRLRIHHPIDTPIHSPKNAAHTTLLTVL